MTWDRHPIIPFDALPAHGKAAAGQVFEAADDLATFVDNSFAEDAALAEAVDRRIAAIEKRSGVKLVSPYLRPKYGGRGAGSYPKGAKPEAEHFRDFEREVIELESKFPDVRRDDRASPTLREDAKKVAREASERFDRATASRRGGIGTFATSVAGGAYGSMRDPVQVLTMFAGGGAGGAKTVGGRILSTFFREAVVNAGVEGALQPVAQKWRKEAGLEYGLQPALRNVALAGAVGGTLGAGARGAGELAGRMLRPDVSRITQPEIEAPDPVQSTVMRAIDGDLDAVVETLAPVRNDLPPAVRGAIDALEAERLTEVQRPADVPPDIHEAHVARAMDAAENPERIPEIIAEANVSRETKGPAEYIPPPRKSDRPQNILEYIAANGGLRDDGGELTARGINYRSSMTKYGPWFRKAGERLGPDMLGGRERITGKGLSPLEMRQKLVEDGFIERPAGRGGLDQSSADDVYDLINRQLAGENVVSTFDRQPQADFDAALKASRDSEELLSYEPEVQTLILAHGMKTGKKIARFFVETEQKIDAWLPEDIALAARLMDEGMDADTAFERAAVMQIEGDRADLSDDAWRVANDAGFGDKELAETFDEIEGPVQTGQGGGQGARYASGQGGQGLPDADLAASRGGGQDAAGRQGVTFPPDIPTAIYRGSGRADQKSVYAHAAVPITGEARYFAFSRKVAETYGSQIEQSALALKNPLIIRSDDEWRALTKSAGWEFNNPIGKSPDVIRKQAADLKTLITSRGHDGVIIWWRDDSPGDIDDITGLPIKNLRDVFGDPQVVDYRTARPPVEPGAEGRPQFVIPGAERASDATMAQRGADAPLRPTVPQRGMETGLFGDSMNQRDMFDAPLARTPEPFDTPEIDEQTEAMARELELDEDLAIPEGAILDENGNMAARTTTLKTGLEEAKRIQAIGRLVANCKGDI